MDRLLLAYPPLGQPMTLTEKNEHSTLYIKKVCCAYRSGFGASLGCSLRTLHSLLSSLMVTKTEGTAVGFNLLALTPDFSLKSVGKKCIEQIKPFFKLNFFHLHAPRHNSNSSGLLFGNLHVKCTYKCWLTSTDQDSTLTCGR